MKFPVFELRISDDDNTGVDFVALVDNPAIEKTFQAFANQKEFKFQSTDKQVVSGPLMIANLPIYRNSPDMGEHYVVFTPATIEKIVHKFFRLKYNGNVNKMHEDPVMGCYMFESYIVDNASGKTAPIGFPSLTDGSWFGSFKIENKDLWDTYIKTGEFKGFSVEGIFEYANEKEIEEKQIENVREAIHLLKEIESIISKV